MKKKLIKALVIVIIVMSALIAVFPVFFTLTNSFMSAKEITNRYTNEITEDNASDFTANGLHYVRLGLIPDQFTLEQYRQLLTQGPEYFRLFWNSVILIIPILLGQCLIAPLTAYAFEGMRWKGKEVIFFIYLIVMLMPTQILLVPNFIMAGWLGIRDSYLAIILPAMFHPLGVFLVRQQLKAFPKECNEAARIDGASEWAIYNKVVRPNLNSVVAAFFVLLFADNWNIIDQAVV
ncbi:MAG TPA: carbohydrate ABC transporter permease, partial [Clostridiales bacterium]|nr:carbohydrate ABC transporter permease [Clostridiales bacterium]